MPKFTANSYLSHKGALVKPGAELELTEEQGKRLADKVTPHASVPEKPLDEKTVPELKAEAKQLEIEGYNDLKKDELVKAITESQK
ncbi:hypothetical protein QOZ98_000505 [Planomicrobium stackebrandtii]|uniref:Rho termination factor-like N-terminal domain-containing protein n=1 Tax=Planomicrobium stackebrandtii TaxID=253160 RepID=A0ABU0GQQ0_9BACL|nr:Rho termination factor N-terminal domain-containing protein [Planomicrobium stackebrandtii]MDQ0427680.1 hypothetical protein [Planomicrobium stackebrandtii]